MTTPKIRECNGRLQIRFTYKGERFTISPGLEYSDQSIDLVAPLVNQIHNDILLNRFVLTNYQSIREPQSKVNVTCTETLIEIWDKYLTQHVAQLEAKTQTQYETFDRILTKINSDLLTATVFDRQFGSQLRDSLLTLTTVDTTKRILTRVNAAINYAGCQSYLGDTVSALKSPKRVKVLPFNLEELETILEAYKEHERWSRYYPFIKFLALTGCRPEEALGLRIESINLDTKSIKICEVITFNKGTATHRNTTKTGDVRSIPINDTLMSLLVNVIGNRTGGLVFQSKKETCLNYRDIQRSWVGDSKVPGIVLTLASEGRIKSYRKLYTLRHSFVSNALKLGTNPVELAAITGHSVRTMTDIYAGLVSTPSLPSFF